MKENVFPTTLENYTFQKGVYNSNYMSSGLTKRELFAAMAMKEICTSPEFGTPENMAKYALKCADALINELRKEKTE